MSFQVLAECLLTRPGICPQALWGQPGAATYGLTVRVVKRDELENLCPFPNEWVLLSGYIVLLGWLNTPSLMAFLWKRIRISSLPRAKLNRRE